MKDKLEQANKQRYIALENAFKTIDAFALPSLTPAYMEKYDLVKGYLLWVYAKDDENIEDLQL